MANCSKTLGETVQTFLYSVFGHAPEPASTLNELQMPSSVVEHDEHGAAIATPKKILLEQGFEVGKDYLSLNTS